MFDKKYNIIYADPPWTYRDKATSGKRGAFFKYDLLTDEEIKNLPVKEISAENCILFLWATFPKIQEALDTIKSWGFEYKTIGFVWVKRNKIKFNSWFWGMGGWTRSNAEICLLGTKGKIKRISSNVHSIIDFPISEHSRKPDIVREKIIELVGDLPKIELFSREKVKGWDCFGNEIKETLISYYG